MRYASSFLEYKLKVLLYLLLYCIKQEIKSTLKKWDFLGVKQDQLNKAITSAPIQYLIFYHISYMRVNRQCH